MSNMNAIRCVLRLAALAAAFAAGLGELAKLQGWRLRLHWLRKLR